MTVNKRAQNIFFITFLGIIAIIIYLIFQPFLSALILAVSLAIVVYPIYERIVKRLNGRRGLGALVIMLGITFVLLIPLTLIGQKLFDEAYSLYGSLLSQDAGQNMLQGQADYVEKYIQQFAPGVTLNIAEYIQYGLQWLLEHLNEFFSGFLHVVVTFVIMIIALFYLLRDGKKLRERFVALSPLSNNYDEQILTRMTVAVNSVIKGSLVIGSIQGLLAGVGAAIFGLPNPVIWGVLAVIGSFIPGLGTMIVMGPGIIYLFVTGNIPMGVGLLIWQLVVVGLVDNFLSPVLLQRGIKIHPFLILLSVLGGISFFGPIGFILGPLTLALLFALLDIYPVILNSHDQ